MISWEWLKAIVNNSKEAEVFSLEGLVVLKMSTVGICLSPFPPSSQIPPPKIQRTLQLSKTHLSALLPNSGNNLISTQLQCQSVSRRGLTISILAIAFPLSLPIARAEQETEIQQYVDSKEGFSLLIPSSYVKVDKAGATLLFEEVNKGSNNVGVVVSPVRLSSLKEFGTPEFVADKVIQAEKRKESTKSIELIGVSERSGKDGLDVYEFEYKVDSTRGGVKRIFSAAMVSQKKLYLLNIAHSDKPEAPLDDHTKSILETVLHSFDVVPLT